MGDRGKRLIGVSVAAFVGLLGAPATAMAAPGLAESVPSLASTAQKPFIAPAPRPTEARARPTDSPDPSRNGYTVPEAPRSPACGPNFCVHWVAEGIDAPSLLDSNRDGVPNYIQAVLQTAEHVHSAENGRLGWREAKSDERRGGGRGKTDVYVSEVGTELFGYAAPDREQSGKGNRLQRRLHGYLVLDNDYSAREFPGTTPAHDLEVTLAHEYCHILQLGYDAFQDPWFAESSAVWMEDQVYNGLNDYLRYMRRWVKRWDTPLTASSIKEYGSAVWNEWLVHRYGLAIVRQAWSRAIHTRPGGFSVAPYDSAIRAAGNSDFNRDFARFAAAVAEWQTGRGFRESGLYPDAPRQSHLSFGQSPHRVLLNHTTFALLRVGARSGRAVAVSAVAPRGIAAAVALVGRIGGERHGRTVTRLNFRPHGGRLSVRLGHPGRFSRVTAVLVNADASAGGFSARRLDWRYLTDRIPFRVHGRTVR